MCVCVYVCMGGGEGREGGRKGRGRRESERCVYMCVCVYMWGEGEGWCEGGREREV